MFPTLSRTIASAGLRAAVRPAARQPTASLLARRQMSAAPAAKKVQQGVDELWPFAKNVPVDVYPLLFIVTVACCGSIYMCGKMLINDKTLRLKPNGAGHH